MNVSLLLLLCGPPILWSIPLSKGNTGNAFKKFPRLTNLLKSFDTDIKRKAGVVEKGDLETFVGSPLLSTPYCLIRKVTIILQAFLCRNQSFLNCQPTELVDLLGPESWILFHQTTAEGRVRNADIRLQHSIYKHSKLWQKILFFMTILSEIFVLFKIFFTYVQIWGYETECI